MLATRSRWEQDWAEVQKQDTHEGHCLRGITYGRTFPHLPRTANCGESLSCLRCEQKNC